MIPETLDTVNVVHLKYVAEISKNFNYKFFKDCAKNYYEILKVHLLGKF